MSEILPSLGRILLMLAAAYGVVAVLAHFGAYSLIFPRPAPSYTLTPDHFHLTAPDGTRVAARYWPNENATHTVLWFHGNGEDLGTIADYLGEWQKREFAILALEYRGYGRSEGRPTEEALYADADLALAWLREERKVPDAKLIIMGYSVGSGPAVELAAKERVGGLILLAPFVSAYRVMTQVPLFPWDKFRNLEKIGRVKCPVLVMHGTADVTIPFWHGKKVYDAVPGKRMHLWVEGAGHGDVSAVAGEEYWSTIRAFADSLEGP